MTQDRAVAEQSRADSTTVGRRTARGQRSVAELVERAQAGEARAVARLISMVEDASPSLREVAERLAPHTGPRPDHRHHRLARGRQVDLDGGPGHGAAAGRQAGRCARRRPLLAVLRGRAARRPGPDAGPRHRLRRLHPLDGHARAPRRTGLGDSAGPAGARRRALRRDPDRDRRRGSVGGRRGRARRHDARAARAGHGRRHPGGEGRDPRDGRRVRRQQGRPGRRRPGGPRPALGAQPRRRGRRVAATDREDGRPERPGGRRPASRRSRSTGPTSTRRGSSPLAASVEPVGRSRPSR